MQGEGEGGGGAGGRGEARGCCGGGRALIVDFPSCTVVNYFLYDTDNAMVIMMLIVLCLISREEDDVEDVRTWREIDGRT